MRKSSQYITIKQITRSIVSYDCHSKLYKNSKLKLILIFPQHEDVQPVIGELSLNFTLNTQ